MYRVLVVKDPEFKHPNGTIFKCGEAVSITDLKCVEFPSALEAVDVDSVDGIWDPQLKRFVVPQAAAPSANEDLIKSLLSIDPRAATTEDIFRAIQLLLMNRASL